MLQLLPIFAVVDQHPDRMPDVKAVADSRACRDMDAVLDRKMPVHDLGDQADDAGFREA
jgi:hypothetical protein